jgi:hypothetical protein
MILSSILGTFGTLSLLALVFILAQLSRRFGAVSQMSPFYRGYYIALIFLAIGWFTHVFVAGAYLEPTQVPPLITQPWFLFVTYHLPLALGVTISFAITWRYWSWLVIDS